MKFDFQSLYIELKCELNKNTPALMKDEWRSLAKIITADSSHIQSDNLLSVRRCIIDDLIDNNFTVQR